MKKIFVGLVFVSLVAAMVLSMGALHRGSQSITLYTDTLANHRDTGTVWVVPDAYHYRTYIVKAKLHQSDTLAISKHGRGKSDTGMVRLVTQFGGITRVLDSMGAFSAIPCSLTAFRMASVSGFDTIVRENLGIQWLYIDTTSDTVINHSTTLSWEIILKE